MKKILSAFLVIALISTMLCSCSADKNDEQAVSDIQIKYTYDNAFADTDSSITRAYETLCDAVVKGESEIGINIGFLDRITQLFYTSFPLSFLVSDIQSNEDGSGAVITYGVENEELNETVKSFSDKINSIITQCNQDTVNDLEYVVKLYNYVTMNAYIDDNHTGINVYSTIMNDYGSVYTYSSMFEYLLLQNDIPAGHIVINKNDSAWAISYAIINGEVYYFDVGSEYKENSGKLLNYFGMTTEDLSIEGYSGATCINGAMVPDSSNLKFSPCRHCKAWELRNGALLVTTNDDIIVEITQI